MRGSGGVPLKLDVASEHFPEGPRVSRIAPIVTHSTISLSSAKCKQ
jgi:hypothetical protein